MTKVLILAAALGLSVSAAGACEYMRSAKASKVDGTVVASISNAQSEPADTSATVLKEAETETTE